MSSAVNVDVILRIKEHFQKTAMAGAGYHFDKEGKLRRSDKGTFATMPGGGIHTIPNYLRGMVTEKGKGGMGGGIFGDIGESLFSMDKNKRFQFEWLGLMFAAMALQRAFTNLLRPSAEIFGIFELINTMLIVLFAPIMGELMPFIIMFVNLVMDIPEPLQLVIGLITILGLIIAGLVFLISQVALGLASLGLAATGGTLMVAGFFLLLKIILVVSIALVGLALIAAAVYMAMSYIPDRIQEVFGGTSGRDFRRGAAASIFGPAAPSTFGMLGVPGFASGGIVTQPTVALLGEQGPEMVIPLGSAPNATFNINANVASNLDVDILARKIFKMMQDTYTPYYRGV